LFKEVKSLFLERFGILVHIGRLLAFEVKSGGLSFDFTLVQEVKSGLVERFGFFVHGGRRAVFAREHFDVLDHRLSFFSSGFQLATELIDCANHFLVLFRGDPTVSVSSNASSKFIDSLRVLLTGFLLLLSLLGGSNA